jgi:hypothetical protein
MNGGERRRSDRRACRYRHFVPTPRKRYLECPCGELLEGRDDDALVAAVQEHLRRVHPNLEYGRDQILLLAY